MTTTRQWDSRPPDVANLFNPAFSSLLLNRLSFGYYAKVGVALPYSLSFLALPILLHPASSDQLPNTSKTNFHGWLLDHPSILIGFSERAAALAPIVREAIAFGLTHGLLTTSEGGIVARGAERELRKWDGNSYNNRYSKEAQLLGKLFAQIGDATTIFALFGVRP